MASLSFASGFVVILSTSIPGDSFLAPQVIDILAHSLGVRSIGNHLNVELVRVCRFSKALLSLKRLCKVVLSFGPGFLLLLNCQPEFLLSRLRSVTLQ